MIRQCQNCKTDFAIEPEDFEFYERINVPPPTWCFKCRLMRKMIWRNERAFYKRKCDAPEHTEETFSIYSQDKPVKVYDQKHWWSDSWDPLEYGQEYDFSKPFFRQFNELLHQVPLSSLDNSKPSTNVNSEYCNDVSNMKNCYLCTSAGNSEECYYSSIFLFSKNMCDTLWSINNENCYECIYCKRCYNVTFSQNSEDCVDSSFLSYCKSCTNCFGCTELRHKKYHIFNTPYSREEYFKKIKELWTGDYSTLEKLKQKYKAHRIKYPHRFANMTNCQNVTGNNVRNSKNCTMCFDTEDEVENSKFLARAGLKIKNCYDLYNSGLNTVNLYDSAICLNSTNTLFSMHIGESQNISYSLNLNNCTNCFGCISLRHKKHCILNKQYTKEEYEKFVPKIIKHMSNMPYTDKRGKIYKYGEFFPPELSIFGYNETATHEYFPLTKEGAIEKDYKWKDPEPRNYKITKKPEDLPDHITNVDNSITQETIQCAHSTISGRPTSRDNPRKISDKEDQRISALCNHNCTTAFKIIPGELEFYRKMNLPLPRLCPNCRHYGRLKQRNPLKLWYRRCMCGGAKSENSAYANTTSHSHGNSHCPNSFETSYAPDRPEIVYCETCYNSEVA